MNDVTPSSIFAKITNYPLDPIDMFKTIIKRSKANALFMNLATIDKEFGVLNRTVMFRGIIDNNAICFVTERNSRKYQNLKNNPKLGLTLLLLLEDTKTADDKVLPETWQVRLLDAEAEEIEGETLHKLWQEEPLFAKIRSQICKCGKPRDLMELEARYSALSDGSMYANAVELPQTKSFTAFKIIAKRWDFYKSEPEKIADRIQYKLASDNQWEVNHVDA